MCSYFYLSNCVLQVFIIFYTFVIAVKFFLQFAVVFKFYYFCDQRFAIIMKLLKTLQHAEYYEYSLAFLFHLYYTWCSKFNCLPI